MRDLLLGDSLEILIDHRGLTPKKLGGDFVRKGVPVASALLVRDGRLDLSDARHVTEEMFGRWMPVRTMPGDVILTSEAPPGRVARVLDDSPLVLGQRLFALRGRPGVLDSGYLYYALHSTFVQSSILGLSTGTTVTGIRQSALRAVRVPAPSFAEQQAIAEVLGALDDKIAANNAMTTVSDAILRTEFASLDRSHRVRVGTVATSPSDPADPRAVDPFTMYVGLEHIPRRALWLTESGHASGVSSGKSRFRPGDTLFGKLRPYFHKVCSSPSAGVCSTDVLVIRATDPAMATVLLAALSSDDVITSVTASSRGTKMPRTSWNDISALSVPWPTVDEAPRLAGRLDALRSATLALIEESRTLAATRDALLPQLMSGKLRVRDAEKVAAEAGA